MRVTRLWLTNFRNYETAELTPDPDGLTVIVGSNGEGKTNLLEAIGYLATLSSLRGVGNEALVRSGAATAIVRGEGRRGRPSPAPGRPGRTPRPAARPAGHEPAPAAAC